MIYLDNERFLPLNNHRIQIPRKRVHTISLALFFAFILLISQILPNISRLSAQPDLPLSDHLDALESMNVDIELPSCIKTYLGKTKPPHKAPNTCQHLPPPRGFCSLLQDLYFSKRPPRCNQTNQATFCHFNEKATLRCKLPRICNGAQLYLGSIDSDNKLKWTQMKESSLQNAVEKKFADESFHDFLILTCSNFTNIGVSKDFLPELGSDPVQLVIPRPQYLKLSSTFQTNPRHFFQSKKLNLNLILIDSLSRNHFYRSLLQTINMMEKLQDDSTVTVIDFEYFQSLKHELAANLELLFSGLMDYSQINKPLNASLTQMFEKNNYQRFYLSDSCENNHEFDKKFYSIDRTNSSSIDLTQLICGMIENLPQNLLKCLNGEVLQKILLEYLYLKQEKFRSYDVPFVTFFQTNIADEETGVRIQSFDKALSQYLKLAVNMEDTITILLSPRGISYGSLFKKSPEGYVEQSNPFMFMLVPKGATLLLGPDRLHSLRRNQQNLVALSDLHAGLHSLMIDYLDTKDTNVAGGIFEDISPTRTCHDLQIGMPNLCICKNFDIPVRISKIHHALADFGIGLLNNKILDMRMRGLKRGFGSCQMLQIQQIRKVYEWRLAADIVQHKLEVEVSGILTSGTDRELFFLVIESGSVEPPLDLVFYQRINLYGSYRSCQDEDVDIDICVCDLFAQDDKPLLPLNGYIEFFPRLLSEFFFDGDQDAKKNFSLHQIMSFIKFKSSFKNVSLEHESPLPTCSQIVHHNFNYGFSLFVANFCHYKIRFKLKMKSKNMYLSKKMISSHTIFPLGIRLLIAGIKSVDDQFFWEYKFQVI